MFCIPVSHVCHRLRLSRKSVRTEIEECSNKAISHKKCAFVGAFLPFRSERICDLNATCGRGALSTRPGPWALTILGISGTKKRKKNGFFLPPPPTRPHFGANRRSSDGQAMRLGRLCWSIPSISVRTDLRLKRDLWQALLMGVQNMRS